MKEVFDNGDKYKHVGLDFELVQVSIFIFFVNVKGILFNNLVIIL